MKERLIELLKEHCVLRQDVSDCTNRKTDDCPECLADYLIENGVIVPPCKVGDVVYQIRGDLETISKGEVCEFIKKKNCGYATVRLFDDDLHIYIPFFSFGQRTFFTKEEAEQALKEGVK